MQNQGKSEIQISDMGSFIAKSGIENNRFRNGMTSLRQRGEITIEYGTSPGGRKVISSIKLNKMASATTIIRREAEAKQSKVPTNSGLSTVSTKHLTAIPAYMKKKQVLVDITAKLKDVGFTEEEVRIDFTPDPLAEEALSLLDLVERAQTAISLLTTERDQLKIEVQSEKEINKRLSDKLGMKAEDYVAPSANAST